MYFLKPPFETSTRCYYNAAQNPSIASMLRKSPESLPAHGPAPPSHLTHFFLVTGLLSILLTPSAGLPLRTFVLASSMAWPLGPNICVHRSFRLRLKRPSLPAYLFIYLLSVFPHSTRHTQGCRSHEGRDLAQHLQAAWHTVGHQFMLVNE